MAKPMTGAEMIVEAMKDQGVEYVFGYPGGAVLPIYDALFGQNQVRHVLVRQERRRGPCGGGLCAFDRQGRRAARHLRPRRHQRDHRPHRRPDGFDPARLHHRSGADASDRLRRVPGMRHDRHHPQLHQAQLSRAPDRGSAAHPARGVLRRLAGSAGARRHRHAQGHPVRDRRLSLPAQHPAQDLSAQAEGRLREDQARHRDDDEGQAAGVLHRRRHHQFRPARLDAAARTGEADRLPDHLDADGARRLSRLGQALARACSACTARSRPTTPCTIATS